MKLGESYWNERWEQGLTGWDIGFASTPLKNYFDQLENKELKILIPGCGNAYEAEYLHEKGFGQVHLLDIAPLALKSFHERFPGFPEDHLINEDFFRHEEQYDLIVEQTFFCALDPKLRENYAIKMKSLLKPGGKLVGLLFNDVLNEDHPPFGGNSDEYRALFSDHFEIQCLEKCYNSIEPRAEREVFIIFEKSDHAR